MVPRRTVLIVGGSLSGITVAESLRSLGDESRIIVLGDEDEHPYDRPPLSKSALSTQDFDRSTLALQPTKWFDDNNIELVVGCAESHDSSTRTVTTTGGEQYQYDELVVATGSRARHLPGLDQSSQVMYLRSWDDAAKLRESLTKPGRLIVVGAGFIGLEVAATAHSMGWQVTLLERDTAPLGRVLPAPLAERCWRPYAEQGLKLRCGASVRSAAVVDDGVFVTLDDGSEVSGDLVLVCAGGMPNSEWLGELHAGPDGVICDPWGRSSSPNISAVGDVACWMNLFTGEARRVEQWQAAKEQSVIVASRLAGVETEGWSDPLYFWSDLIAGRVQLLGAAPSEAEIVSKEFGDGKCLSLVGSRGHLVGIFTEKYPRGIARGRALVTSQAPWNEALEWAEELTAPRVR